MGQIWSDENKYRMWLEVEAAASETLAEDGIVPVEAAKAIRERGKIDVARIQEIEAEVRHDVVAFTTAVAEKIIRRPATTLGNLVNAPAGRQILCCPRRDSARLPRETG